MGLLKFAAVVLLYAVVTQGNPAAEEPKPPVEPAVAPTCAWGEWSFWKGCHQKKGGAAEDFVQRRFRRCKAEEDTEAAPGTAGKLAKRRRGRGKCAKKCSPGNHVEEQKCDPATTVSAECEWGEWGNWRKCHENKAGNMVQKKWRRCKPKAGTEEVAGDSATPGNKRKCFMACTGMPYEERTPCQATTGGNQGNRKGKHGSKRGGRPRGGNKSRGGGNKGRGGGNKGRGGGNKGRGRGMKNKESGGNNISK